MSPDPKKCGKKTNLLIYRTPSAHKLDRNNPCNQGCQKSFKPPICHTKGRPIRVCTGAELKRMCPPRVCPCPPDKGNLFLSMLGFLLKTAVAAGAMYVSYDLGVWGTTEDTHRMYRAYCSILSEPSLKRATKWDPPSCDAEKDMFKLPRFNPHAHCDKPPVDFQKHASNFQNCWNKTIQFIFGGLAGFPNNIMNALPKEEKKKAECVNMKVDPDTGLMDIVYK